LYIFHPLTFHFHVFSVFPPYFSTYSLFIPPPPPWHPPIFPIYLCTVHYQNCTQRP
jgi:hypothetical protein